MRLRRIAMLLRVCRAVTGQEQDELAAEIGISQSALSKIENGAHPTAAIWQKLTVWMDE